MYRVALVAFLAVVASGCFGAVADGSLAVDVSITDVLPNELSSSGGVQVTVLGSHFRDGTQVFVGGQPAAQVTVVDDQHLTFVAPPSAPGEFDLFVTSPGGSSATWKSGLRYFAQTVDLRPAPLLVNGGPQAIDLGSSWLADVDGDGRDDLVTIGFGPAGSTDLVTITTLLNRDQGRRFDVADTLVAPKSQCVSVLDLDGDGRSDLLIGTDFRLAGPDGHLGAAASLPSASGETLGCAVVGDFDGDKARELAVMITSQDGNTALGVHLFRVSSSGQVQDLRIIDDIKDFVWEAADVDHDGYADLIWISNDGLHVRFGPELDAAHEWLYSFAGQSIAPVKFSLVATSGGPGLDILLDAQTTDPSSLQQQGLLFVNTGKTFANPIPESPIFTQWLFPTRFGPQGYTASFCTEGLCLTRWANGLPQETSVAPSAFMSAAVGELDGYPGPDVLYEGGTGTDELFAAFGAVNQAGTSFESHSLSQIWTLPLDNGGARVGLTDQSALVRGNFGNDGVLAAGYDEFVTFVSGGDRPAAIATISLNLDPNTPIAGLYSCDINGDGIDDVVAAIGTSSGGFNSLRVVLVKSDGPQISQTIALPNLSYQAYSGRFDDNGPCSLIVAPGNYSDPSSSFIYLKSDGDGLAIDSNKSLPFTGVRGVFDFDGDGFDDIYTIEADVTGEGKPYIWLNDGHANFQKKSLLPDDDGTLAYGIAFHRLADGTVEAILLSATADGSQKLLRATLQSDYSLKIGGSSDEYSGGYEGDLLVADLNGDGELDAISRGTWNMFAARDGSFAPLGTLQLPGFGGALQLTPGMVDVPLFVDLNGDHLDDFVFTTNGFPAHLGIVINHSR